MTIYEILGMVLIGVCLTGLMLTTLWYWLSCRLDKIEDLIENHSKQG